MGFVDSLRMQNIFPNSKIPLGFTGKIPAYGGSDPMEQIISRYQELLPPEQPMMEPSQSSNRIGEIANKLSQPKMNVIFKDEMTPYQKESLALRRSGQENTRTNQEVNRDLAGKRVSISEFKAKNPNKQFKIVDGKVYVADPASGNLQFSGVEGLTREEELELMGKNAENLEGIRQTNRTKLEGTRQNNRLEVKQYDKDNPDDEWGNPLQTFNPDGTPGLLIQVNKKDGSTRRVQTPGITRATAPGTQPPLQPSQQINERKLKIQEVLARNPNWSRYIDQETGQVKPVGTGYGENDLTEEKRNTIVEAIYGKGGDSNPPANTGNPNNVPANTAPVNTLPSIEQRVVGQVYTLGNGTKATWNGRSFNPVQE